MFRITKTLGDGSYTQMDFKSLYAAAQQINRWAMQKASHLSGKVTFTIEVMPL